MGSTTALNFYHTPFAIVGRRGQPECEDGRRAQGPQNSEGKREKFLFFFGREEEKGFLLVESKMNWNWNGKASVTKSFPLLRRQAAALRGRRIDGTDIPARAENAKLVE